MRYVHGKALDARPDDAVQYEGFGRGSERILLRPLVIPDVLRQATVSHVPVTTGVRHRT